MVNNFLHFNSGTARKVFLLMIFILISCIICASSGEVPSIGPIRVEFIIFGFILSGVAVFHKQTFWVAVIGLIVLLTFKFIFDPGFHLLEHLSGTIPLNEQLADKDLRQGEWGIILNLFGLLLGFAVLSKIFEDSGIPGLLPKYLPNDWKGPFLLLLFVFILSGFLDNIAAALIGGTIALVVFNRRVHIGYIVAIVAASNAGGAGSDDWRYNNNNDVDRWGQCTQGHSWLYCFHICFYNFCLVGSHQQDKLQKIQKDALANVKIDWKSIFVVCMILIGAVISNILYDMPALGVWISIIIGSFIIPVPWKEIPGAIKGTLFLLCLVMCASLMPVEELPDASWTNALALGFLSAVFDNIPLTKLCLEQGHYDWGMLAYSVGFGGSMIWFGSSAGVAITNKFSEARNVGKWVKNGWHVIIAYIVGFFALYLILGWDPSDNKKHKIINCPVPECSIKG